jgi:hypothetical protein
MEKRSTAILQPLVRPGCHDLSPYTPSQGNCKLCGVSMHGLGRPEVASAFPTLLQHLLQVNTKHLEYRCSSGE